MSTSSSSTPSQSSQPQKTPQPPPLPTSPPPPPPSKQQLAIPMERRDTGESRSSTGSKRVSFLSQPSVEVKRYGSRRGRGRHFFTRPSSIVRQVFVLFALLALLLSVWYLVTSVIFKPVKEILLEELGSDGAEELLARGQSRGNMTEVFSNAISDLLGSGDNRTTVSETSASKFNGSYVI